MSEAMTWRTLDRFRDETVPKLNNLRIAHAAGLRVPPTFWLPASAAQGAAPPGLGPGPLIIRSASPTEDQRTSSHAGQLLSLIVRERGDFADALRRVVDVLPGGAVFVQPLIESAEAGVAFFDGFYCEKASAAGGNQAVTAGHERGDVRRGHLIRDEPWSEWLSAVYRVFGRRDERLDVEYARDDHGFILLQVRPALFPIVRNYTLTMANVVETLGDFPSPWSVSSAVAGSFGQAFLATLEPAIGRWQEPLVVEVGGRPWLNVSFWFRWCDHIGVPRTLITEGLGGSVGSPADKRLIWGRLLAALPRVVWGHRLALARIFEATRSLRQLGEQIEAAKDLDDLYRATTLGWKTGGEVALSIGGVRVVAVKLRGLLGLPGPRVITQAMMEDYAALRNLPPERQAAGLDAWLSEHGHRGPFESDVGRPRFSELREVLLRDLATGSPLKPSAAPSWCRRLLSYLTWPLGWPDQRREWFRDAWMRRWAKLRQRLLTEGERLAAVGELDAADDVFWLHGDDLRQKRTFREAVAERRRLTAVWRPIPLPLTATADELQGLLNAGAMAVVDEPGHRVFPGIALTKAVVEGVAVKANDLLGLLAEAAANPNLLNDHTILVVPALEPSWAVVFPRVAGVVAEVGGEMSHASILLREANKPAVVNCAGIFRTAQNGDRLRMDGMNGTVALLPDAEETPKGLN